MCDVVHYPRINCGGYDGFVSGAIQCVTRKMEQRIISIVFGLLITMQRGAGDDMGKILGYFLTVWMFQEKDSKFNHPSINFNQQG